MSIYTWIGSFLFVIVLVLFILIHFKYRRSFGLFQYSNKPIQRTQHSPEYRHSTKCFDCIEPRSHEFWNESHPAKLFAGL
jgi:hypothetical protein